MKLRQDLTESGAGHIGFHQVWPEMSDIRQQAQLTKQFSKWHTKHVNDS